MHETRNASAFRRGDHIGGSCHVARLKSSRVRCVDHACDVQHCICAIAKLKQAIGIIERAVNPSYVQFVAIEWGCFDETISTLE